jgi:hypothetical protein
VSREQEIRQIIDRFLARVRQDVDARLETLGADLLGAIAGNAEGGRVALERAAVDVARAVARGGGHARHDLITRIITAVRRLDEASTLRGILDALVEGASAEADAAAVLIVSAGNLQTYRHHGFEPGRAPIDLPVDASPLLTNVVTFRQAASVPPVGLSPDPQLPGFMRVPSGRVGLAIPLVVGKEVVAVVYAEGAERAAGEPGEPVWTEQVEVLVRHAAARLENVTSMRTVEVLSTS